MAWKGEVLANNEAGQVTSIIYNPGDVITIVAAGWASYGPTQKWGPQGDREHPDQGLICHDAFCGALVMKIGNSGTIPVNTGLFRWVAPNNVQGAITLSTTTCPEPMAITPARSASILERISPDNLSLKKKGPEWALF